MEYGLYVRRFGEQEELWILNVIDDHSRECLCYEVSRSFGGYDVAEALDRLICLYGKPNVIKSDNGTMLNEILRGVEFESVREAREELEKWREKYNNERPHSALTYEPPSSLRRPHGGDTNRFNLESINPINNNINQVNLLP